MLLPSECFALCQSRATAGCKSAIFYESECYNYYGLDNTVDSIQGDLIYLKLKYVKNS